jgi:hypothetical protein
VANAPLLELKSKVLIVFVPEVEVVGVTVSETVDAVAGAAERLSGSETLYDQSLVPVLV